MTHKNENPEVVAMVNKCHLGNCMDVLRTLPDNSVDSIVTDPPYGLTANKKGGTGVASINTNSPAGRSRIGVGNGAGGFMGCKWDSDVPSVEIWSECLRVLKPGGYLLAFAGTRTQHRMAVRIEDAGFEIRDMLAWVYGSGFPKSHNGEWGGTALKPALEPITMARKPLIGTVAANWAKHGTGALNIDGCRIDTEEPLRAGSGGIPCRHDSDIPRRPGEASAERTYAENGATNFSMKPGPRGGDALGRWPANLIHDGSAEVLASFPEAKSGGYPPEGGQRSHVSTYGKPTARGEQVFTASEGSAARFFYCAKASGDERNEGLQGFAAKQQDAGRKDGNPGGDNPRNRGLQERQNHHPTVKPVDLMRYLCRLVTPTGGIVLDPFIGSGTTCCAAVLEGFQFIGIEREAEYIEIARARIASAMRQGFQPSLNMEAA